MLMTIYMIINMDTGKQNRKSAHNVKVRDKILDAAADVFRRAGYAEAGIDQIMAAADLTRGAFYAHFKSKEALFDAVLRHRHPFLDRLARLPDDDLGALRNEFSAYLDPENLAEVSVGCTLVALTGEAARRSDEIRLGLGAARNAILEEMERVAGKQAQSAQHDAALSLATGALQMAAADCDVERQKAILNAANDVVQTLL